MTYAARERAATLDTVAKIEALALAVQHVMATAAGNATATTQADLQVLGLNLSGLNATTLSAVQTAMAATADDGSALDTLGKLQALVDSITNQLPSVSGLQMSNDTGRLNNDFVTNQALQTLTATLSATLGVHDHLYGRLDGVSGIAAGGAGWTDLTSMVSTKMSTRPKKNWLRKPSILSEISCIRLPLH